MSKLRNAAFGRIWEFRNERRRLEYQGILLVLFCKRRFYESDQTLQEMIASSIKNMTQDLQMPLGQATDLANSFIPTLKRWRN